MITVKVRTAVPYRGGINKAWMDRGRNSGVAGAVLFMAWEVIKDGDLIITYNLRNYAFVQLLHLYFILQHKG